MDNTTLLGILFASASFWLVTHGAIALLDLIVSIRNAIFGTK